MRCILPHLLVAVVVTVVLLGSAAGFSMKMFGSKVLTRSKMQLFASTETESTDETKFNPRDDRRRIMKSENYNRMGFKQQKKAVEEMMNAEFASPLLQEMRANNGVLKRGDLTIRLAEHYGFCWGVERSIAMAYEARAHFPNKTLHITNEIIHNPQVNDRLHEMQVHFLEPAQPSSDKRAAKDFSHVQSGDVVLLPAFGATIQELQLLEARNVTIVDTTCPWVSKVWNAVDNHRKAGQTSIIHGKYAHEETIATASFCDDYLILKDLDDAHYVAHYIVHGGDKEAFRTRFAHAMSPGFDPDVHLQKIGLANQTTMYKRETKAIGRVLEVALLKRYGPANLSAHYAEFDTICDATQERQDAVTALVTGASYADVMQNEASGDNKHDRAAPNPYNLDFVLVVGGFDSSNTAHLQEIPRKYAVPSYHIDRASRIAADNSVAHRCAHSGEVVVEEAWLKKGPMTIGVTSGASTPDRCVEEALEQLFLLHKLL